MDCHGIERAAFAVAENRLSKEEDGLVRAHLAQCEPCRSLIAFMRQRVREAQETEDAELSPFFWTRLKHRIDAYESGQTAGVRRFVPARLGLRPAALAACLFMAVWAGFHLGSAYTERTSPVTSQSDQESEDDLVDFLAIIDDVPHGSFAELLIEESSDPGLEP
jgi:hypothetical protein